MVFGGTCGEGDQMSDPGTALIWRKRCNSSACVEVAVGATAVYVRESTNPDGPRLVFTPQAWAAFVSEIRSTGFLR
jgi:hypothetical protein